LDATYYLQRNRIVCTKYNYSLDESVQNFSSFQGYLQLSQDGKHLSIILKKPIAAHVDENNYVEPDVWSKEAAQKQRD
jgi:hypothetical protein